MHTHVRLRARRFPFSAVAVLSVASCLVAPAAAAAHGGAGLQTSVSEGSATAPLQEPVGETTAPTGAPETTAPTGAPQGSGSETRSEERQRRREERVEEREARRARRQESHGPSACTIDLESSARILAAGAPLTLQGTLDCSESESAVGQTVTLYQKLARTPGFTAVATTSTEAGGAFHFSPADLEINSVFFVRADGAKSLRASVGVAPQVTLTTPAPGTPLLAGDTRAKGATASTAAGVPFSGTVSPADTGATVSLERQFGKGSWRRIGGGGVVDEEGKFTIAEVYLTAGAASLRVVVHSHGFYVTTASSTVTYEVSRHHGRLLTIAASSDPIAYGVGVTITGTVPGASDRPVTLLAQTGNGPFAPVASATTNGSEYTFSVSPLQSTRYRVVSGTLSSEVLAEGVTSVLSATPPPTSVHVGEQVTFTGTVTPAHEGQVVSLERENAAGIWHSVLATATVTATGSYSIPYTFTLAGSELLRVVVPAGEELQGTSGELLKLEVAPAL
jgi:plastocyanin